VHNVYVKSALGLAKLVKSNPALGLAIPLENNEPSLPNCFEDVFNKVKLVAPWLPEYERVLCADLLS